MTKVIGVGNTLMGDDGIGVLVIKELQHWLEKENFEVVIGGVDPYIAYEVDKEEELIIVDSMKSGLDVGEITVLPLERFKNLNLGHKGNHDLSLVDMLRVIGNPLKGAFIGIEIKDPNLEERLSEELKHNYDAICWRIFQLCLCLKK